MSLASVLAAGEISNPVARRGADPWVTFEQGQYHYCYSARNQIWVNRAAKLQDVVQRRGRSVWTPPENTPYSQELWAPELHFIQGKWYIYVAADDGRNETHRMVVLESESSDSQGPYQFRGKLAVPSDKWAIDGTVLEHRGQLYFIWSGWEGDVNVRQDLYIAKMSDPVTLTGARVLISKPELDWELNGTPLINEGPQILKKDGRVFVIYSASGSWTDDYCLGQLSLTGDDPMKASAWTKKPTAVFKSTAKVISPWSCVVYAVTGWQRRLDRVSYSQIPWCRVESSGLYAAFHMECTGRTGVW